MIRWLREFLCGSSPAKAAPTIDLGALENAPRYQAALELERRLYEGAIADLNQTFAKEGLVAAFLTSGAIVAFAGSLQAFAQVVSQVAPQATLVSTILLM